jgi:hypothetical protein
MSGRRGEQNRFSKLVEIDVLAMRALDELGVSPYVLAKIFLVSRPQAKRVVRGVKWGWLTWETYGG